MYPAGLFSGPPIFLYGYCRRERAAPFACFAPANILLAVPNAREPFVQTPQSLFHDYSVRLSTNDAEYLRFAG